MDVNTGRLVADIDFIAESERHRFTRVPDLLVAQAEKELAGQREVIVNMRRKNELVRWAKGQKDKNRARAKLAKKSRARNR